MGRRRAWETCVAGKSYLGVTVGYLVGWKSPYCDFVRNIRAGLFFKTAAEAHEFRERMESGRQDVYPSFEVLEKAVRIKR